MKLSASEMKGFKPAKKRQTAAEFKQLQRLTFSAVRRKLSPTSQMQRTWTDGRKTAEVVGEFIKPNDRLTSFERLEIYNKQYWFRLLDCLYDDFPGLRAILGEKRFRDLRIAYLDRYPSTSFTMRNLGSRMAQFLQQEPRFIEPRRQMCLDMAHFEWAQVVGFDGPERKPLAVDDLLGKDATTLRLGLQPYITLLEMAYPLDEFVLALKKKSLRADASNAIEMDEPGKKKARAVRLPRARRVFVAVHRWNNSLYYKRVDEAAFLLLTAIRDGATLADACAVAIDANPEAHADWASQIREWFQVWAELGWFVQRRAGE